MAKDVQSVNNKTNKIILQPPLSDTLFNELRKYIHETTGISMKPHKKALVANRLRKRIKILGLISYDEYYDYLKENEKQEIEYFIDAVSTNETYFFREKDHFEVLSRVTLPELFRKKDLIKMWCAACSSGEEPYTIWMVVNNAINLHKKGTAQIIATDISNEIIEKAKKGIYNNYAVRSVPSVFMKKYFKKEGELFKIQDEVKKGIRFKVQNLLYDMPPGKNFDIIFCRNVMIYFDDKTKEKLVDRVFAPVLEPDGYLFIGHSESINYVSKCFKYKRLLNSPVYVRR